MLEGLKGLLREHGAALADRTDAEAEAFRRDGTPDRARRRMVFVLITSASCLMFVRFAGTDDHAKWLVALLDGVGLEGAARHLEHTLSRSPDKRLWQRVLWASTRIVGYGLLPWLAVKLLLREPLSEHGLGLAGIRRHAWIYPALFGLVLPFVVLASYGASFQARYPYYKLQPGEPLWPALVLWEVLYASQFVALEFFFRGFFIHGLKKTVGYAAVFIPIVPYAMIHFGKPLPEAIGSIVTGFVLGSLSLRSQSIWGGASIHVAVASSMDLLSLWHRGLL